MAPERRRRGRLPSTLATVVAATLWLAAPLHAGSSQKKPAPASCKKIRDAVWANHTLDQIIAEFDTDAEHVMKCTQKQGKRRAAPKEKKKGSKGGKPHKSAAPPARLLP